MPVQTTVYFVDEEDSIINGTSKAKVSPPRLYYDTKPSYWFYIRDRDNNPVAYLEDTDSVKVTVNTRVNPLSSPAGEAAPADCVIVGADGLIKVNVIDFFTASFLEIVENEDNEVAGYFFIQVTKNGEASPSKVYRIPCYLRNVDSPTSTGTPP